MRKLPETLDTACYTASRNRKGHRSPDQHDRFQAWTVSSCSPHCGHPPRMASPGRDRLSAGPTTDTTVAQALNGAARDVAQALSLPRRHSCRRPSVQQTTGEEDRPLAAVLALLLRAAVEVRSTGARGASHKKGWQIKRGNQRAGHLTQNPPSSPTLTKKPKSSRPRSSATGCYPSPTTVSEKQKSPKPLHFL